MNFMLTIIAATICILWGIGHLIPSRNIIAMFGELSIENKRILTMEWIAEGLTLVFLGVLIGAVALWGTAGETVRLVLRLSSGMLLIMAGLSAATGARTSILPMRICPVVKTTSAVLVIVATW